MNCAKSVKQINFSSVVKSVKQLLNKDDLLPNKFLVQTCGTVLKVCREIKFQTYTYSVGFAAASKLYLKTIFIIFKEQYNIALSFTSFMID